MATYSNWREDLIEVIDTPTTEKKAEKKIKETKVNNKIVINPTFKESVAAMGGEILEMKEVDNKDDKKNDSDAEQKEKAKQEAENKNLKAKEKRVGLAKRMILQKKVQAVRAGAGADITAGYEPEGEVLDERLGGKGYKPYTSLTGKKVSGDWEDSDRGAGNKAKKRSGGKVEKKSPTYLAHVHNKEERVFEGVMKFIKDRVGGKKKPEKKAEKAMDAGARARRKLQQKDHEKVNFLPMEEEKDAYKYVVSKLKKKYGDGVLTKGDKMPEPSAAQKKKNAEIMAKRAKQDGRDATEKASDGRYSDRYSNRGSD